MHSATPEMHHTEGKDMAKDMATISKGKGIQVQHQATISEGSVITTVKASLHNPKQLTVITVYKIKKIYKFYLPATLKHPSAF